MEVLMGISNVLAKLHITLCTFQDDCAKTSTSMARSYPKDKAENATNTDRLAAESLSCRTFCRTSPDTCGSSAGTSSFWYLIEPCWNFACYFSGTSLAPAGSFSVG